MVMYWISTTIISMIDTIISNPNPNPNLYYFNIILIDNNRTCPVGVNEIPERCYSKGYVFKKLNEKEIIREFFCVSFTMTI